MTTKGDEMSKDLLVLADEYAAATATFARALALKDEADSMSPIAREAGDKRAVLAEALAALDTAQPALSGCACRWDAEGNRITTCTRHQGWLDVVYEWADRARVAEAKLAQPPAPSDTGRATLRKGTAMTNYQELKRLAEAAKLELADIANVVIEDGDLSHHELFQSLASPDVVLGLIKSLEHTTMAAEAEAKEVDERNAVIAGLRTQNQALMEALERMVESVTGVDQVSAVNEARAALTAAKQAQPEREMQKLFLTAGLFPDACKFDADGSPSFYTKESADKFAAGKLDVPCKGKNCGSLNGWLHSAECRAEHEAACSEQAQPERAPLSDAELEQEFCNITGLETGINPAAADTKRALVWFKKGYAHAIKQGGQHA